MPSLPEIDPADVIHYFTNAVNLEQQDGADCEDKVHISEDEPEFVPCTQGDGQQVPMQITKFLRLPVQRMNQSSHGGRKGVLRLNS